MNDAIRHAMELVSTDSAVAERVSKAYFDSLKDDGVDIGTATDKLFALASESAIEGLPSCEEIYQALSTTTTGTPVRHEAQDGPLGEKHLDKISRVNLGCSGAFVARLNIINGSGDTIWTGDWIPVGRVSTCYLDKCNTGGTLESGEYFRIVIEIGAGDDQYWVDWLVYRGGYDVDPPRYAANFTVSGTTCNTNLYRDEDTDF
ncbi:hypothetical protein [Bifidobacterium crudilactis]|jgi:hypothetical protein|uniref:Uncharacterized protein n=2 Tax=Bifidobacterium crudilactis TaxID=327277 RepID=A0A971ICJ7_9BIFI|nr:hypothetical protein [Bifidobacterium crudilactis]MCI1868379.1 hypothetical protein [Bifidobacterium crudilactis]MDN5972084.1 hypothetical protein [Bifidobacterium crudilactis]MDN5999967.1 hypothetical protein [Bifidobacterium crudilactis]MDN6233601.1 hypothetical protein [Bifidobacterium crudilactis]MDN6466655.1 hypothetical protein [Bifidobacterium crudilactis]